MPVGGKLVLKGGLQVTAAGVGKKPKKKKQKKDEEEQKQKEEQGKHASSASKGTPGKCWPKGLLVCVSRRAAMNLACLLSLYP